MSALTTSAAMVCREDTRRRQLFGNSDWNGIDYIEVSDDQLSLAVYFFDSAPKNLTPANIHIDGGRRITGIQAIGLAPAPAGGDEADECLIVSLDRYGDFSTYTLRLVEIVQNDDGSTREQPLSGFDSRYVQLDFNFKIDCPSDFDCAVAPICPPEASTAPDINYLAKDYESFRQLMFDRLAVTMPDWRERHVPDIGVTLVELLAYVADQLSYYQDAVATEAYLDTARTRISVRRHARLVDYHLHEGCNARAWLTIGCSSNATLTSGSYYFVTRETQLQNVARGRTLLDSDLELIPANLYEVFEPVVSPPGTDVHLYPERSTIHFYTWGDEECCLVRGATCATLIDPTPQPSTDQGAASTQSRLSATADGKTPKATASASSQDTQNPLLVPGDVLIFEEMLGPTTGNPADADPTHRCAVRLTKATYTTDPLFGQAIVNIEWAQADALPFALCLSARLPAPDCRRIGDISVAHGNVILVDHGACVNDDPCGVVGSAGGDGCCGCDGVVLDSVERPAKFTQTLRQGPLIYREPPPQSGPASTALTQDPRQAIAQLKVTEMPAGAGSASVAWSVRTDLLASGSDDRDVVVEVDDQGLGHLRFGDGRLGRRPDAGSSFGTHYRVGVEVAGKVPAEAIAYIVFRNAPVDGANLVPRNPMPAQGGTAPETLAEAKLAAPHAFRSKLLRAITADDYAQLAQNDAKLQRANTRLAWTGSWYEADVAIDPLGAEDASAALCAEVECELQPFRRVGQDLEVQPARYVPLAITLQICVLPDYLRGHVAAALIDAFSNRRLADGSLGFFHPDRLSFGDDVYAPDLISTAQRIEGVQSVKLVELRRWDAPASAFPPGELKLACYEIAQLDNDPNYPEHGKLTLNMGGGR
ncbi:MAG TPA: putative baseplate assembly protein [Rudaea sp.]|jgi:hypothetical protein|uniref:putative baseplate assembly protein n=1 Tax=Rudaea sp. TaxID=2136325 RepID=UPI002F929FB6